MRHKTWTALFVGAAFGAMLGSAPLAAQSCKDEEAMVADYKKTLAELVETVKKESLTDFEKAYHQRTTQTKLTLYLNMVDGLLGCLDKASQDGSASKDDQGAYKAKRDTYGKLKEHLQQEKDALKATQAPKDAKALIEKFAAEG